MYGRTRAGRDGTFKACFNFLKVVDVLERAMVLQLGVGDMRN
jgi:hypothetical protein